MPDPRFFEDLGPVTLGELARLTGAEVADEAADLQVSGVSILPRARPDEIAFFSDRRRLGDLSGTRAGACFVSARDAGDLPASCVGLVTATPQAAFAVAAARLHRLRRLTGPQNISPLAVLEEGLELAPGVVVGAGAKIGRGTVIGANAVIGPGVCIGRDCSIGANVAITCALIGDRVKILSGAVIGEAGFGAAAGAQGLVDMPQLGRVILQDAVTIGALSAVDRGAYDDTVIGERTKIDNLVMIGHNTRVGRDCVMAAHTGISGSVKIGDGVAFGGKAGIADHVTIGDGAQIAAGGGVIGDVPARERWGGYPARPMKQWLREAGWVARNAGRRKEGRDE
jgi:UDP-3-O-[3-hydroxymyristoyl] glucosamine N-acyltransferase